MSEECKVLSVHRDGSTTIKKMLIDGHNYTLVLEGKKVIHKKHAADCAACLPFRLEHGISIMVDGKEHRLSSDEQLKLTLRQREGDTRPPEVILGLKPEEHPVASAVGNAIGWALGLLTRF